MLKLTHTRNGYHWHCYANGQFERHGPFITVNEALFHMKHNAPVDRLVNGWHLAQNRAWA